MLRSVNWLGLGIVVAGLALGVVLAAGMHAAEQRVRASVTPVPTSAGRPAAIVLDMSAVSATSGRTKYEGACAGCHGSTGQGDAPLHGPLLRVYYKTDAALAGVIRNGVGTMPPTTTDDVSDRELADVVAYVRSLP
jgi:mono/diheme cytochrome c family protein